MNIEGGCHCGNLTFGICSEIDLPQFHPRACDCDFCTRHGAMYFSDKEGSVTFSVNKPELLIRYRQGDGLAEFLVCGQCGVLTGVTCTIGDGVYGAVNCKAISVSGHLAEPLTVSPRKLPAGEKLNRWQEIWFPRVELVFRK